MVLTFKDLPKISLNKWYAGQHWTKRQQLKETYYYIIKSQFKGVFNKSKQYSCKYVFYFKTKPLDASNCVAMVKLIEDIIFEDDKWDIVTEISIQSKKGKENLVTIEIE